MIDVVPALPLSVAVAAALLFDRDGSGPAADRHVQSVVL